MKQDSLVLITTAIKPPSGIFGLEMQNVSTRTLTTKGAIFFWAASGVKKIVIADATGQTILSAPEITHLNQMNIDVEQINYLQNNDLIVKKGKGYGEGALIKYALENSPLLQTTENFFKCTGKIYCRNFQEILNIISENAIQNFFWQEVFGSEIDTRFFYTSKDFCKRFLLPAYENIDDSKKFFSEHSVKRLAEENLTQVTSIRPLLSGFSGSLNLHYFDKSMGFLDHNLTSWISK